MTVRKALERASELLARAGVDSPGVDAEWLAAHVLGVSRSTLHVEPDRFVAPEALVRFERLVERRAAREPLAYVLGEWDFRRLTLGIDRRALVPRPETETVVERCLALLAEYREPRVLDVGVGSGAIALAIADEHPAARVTAVDVSAGALELARENALRTGVGIELRHGGIDVAAEGWDLVVSNPPYVAAAEYERLEPELRDWEPRAALLGEGVHAELARAARTAWLVLETGDGQAAEVAVTLERLGYRDVRISRDLTGRERVVEGGR